MPPNHATILEQVDKLIGSNFYLYHYSKEKYTELLTLQKQVEKRIITKLPESVIHRNEHIAKYQDPEHLYSNHISFLFDPLPLDVISKANYPKNHIYKSKKLYEYIIDIRKLEKNIIFAVKETPFNNFLVDLYRDGFPEFFEYLYFKIRESANYILKDKGKGLSSLESIIARYRNQTRNGFINLINSKDFEEYKTYYAPKIPHIMLYPSNGIIKPIKVNVLNIDY